MMFSVEEKRKRKTIFQENLDYVFCFGFFYIVQTTFNAVRQKMAPVT